MERTREADVIYGADLIKYQRQAEFAPGISDKIDPEGLNIVMMTMIHNDMELRLIMLFKLIGREEPFQGSVTLPFNIAKAIMQRMKLGESHVN